MHVASVSEQIPFMRYSFLGACVALLGLYIESIADRQKFQFKRQYPTKRCNTWLWSKARYPNYFGEMLFWIGIYGVALSGLQWIQVVLWLLSPCIIIRLLLFVTGIPPLEKEHEQKWGQDLERRDYEKKTNLLFPW
jgi:steroid 5-alpha reductase family enzyme